MFGFLIKGFLAGFAVRLLNQYRQLTLDLLRIETAKCYLRGVQMARLSAMGLVGMGLLVGVICFGAALLHAGLFILLPWSLQTKAILGMILGLVYVIAGAVAIRAALNEKTWMDKSGAGRMLEEAIGRSKSEVSGNERS